MLLFYMALFFFLSSFLLVFFLIQGVAFVTLWERHLLGLTQSRVGPMKVGFIGFLQPILDGIKLLKKELLFTSKGFRFIFLFPPFISFLLLFLEWSLIPYPFLISSFSFSLIFFFVVVGCGVYPILLSGSFSASKFAMLGAVRSSAQMVSFEVLFSLFLLSLVLFLPSWSLSSFVWNFLSSLFFSFFFVCVLVELNRTPFDFSEGESELVSGYNVEYSSEGFVLFFLKEYGSLLFFSCFLSMIFCDFGLFQIFLFFTLIIYIRSSLPRFRYDLLMSLFWFKGLPFVALVFLFIFIFFL